MTGDGISRRDFVQGRFWQAIGRKRRAGQTDSGGDSERGSMVMRYPKTASDVEAATDANNSTSDAVVGSNPVVRHATIPVLRPPGAVDEQAFLSGCTKCNRCIEVCPHDAIVQAPARMRAAAGTPMLDPDVSPCRMCADTPCIDVCEPNVLTHQVATMMGTAIVTEHLCLAHHGTTCTVCSEQCPVENAIRVSDGKPTVDESLCTGCGVCRYVCPAPENAVLLMPTFSRPSQQP